MAKMGVASFSIDICFHNVDLPTWAQHELRALLRISQYTHFIFAAKICE